LHNTFRRSWQLPADTPPEHVKQLMSAWRQKLLTEKWMNTANDLLDGDSPASASGDAARRPGLLAALEVLEYSLADPFSSGESTAFRERLGLPADEPIDPTQMPPMRIPLTRLARLPIAQLSDDDLEQVYRRAVFARIKPVVAKVVDELLARPSLDGKIDKAQALGMLAGMEHDSGIALELIEKARSMAEAAGQSSAPWDLEELELLLTHGEGEAAMRLINHLQSQHRREPGVMERLLQILYEAGIVDEHGRPIPRQAPEPAGLVVPGAAAEPGKIWTPDSDTPSGKKTALWTPGMD
jgi:hypothetical protein